MFASNEGDNILNESSAGAIPINSMYEGEEERQAAIPPALAQDVIEESKEEQNIVQSSHSKDAQQPPTAQTQ